MTAIFSKCRWELDCKRLWSTLTGASADEAWGFSLTAGAAGDMGQQAAHWRGIVAHRGDTGTWLKVGQLISSSL